MQCKYVVTIRFQLSTFTFQLIKMRTEIATLGEFGLIRHLTEGIELKNESSRYGIGDDAAVLSYPADKEVLVTTDLLLEGVHFDLTYVPLKHLGYMP